MRRIAHDTYIHQHVNWPNFHWNNDIVLNKLIAIRHQQGILLGRMSNLGFSLRGEAMLKTLTLDVLKSNEIEGEMLNPEQVRSSIARRLGMEVAGLIYSDRNVEGVVEMILDATQNFSDPLSEERLFAWHAALFPTGRSGMYKIKVAEWRSDSNSPMQVVSGGLGHEKIHFEAPIADIIPKEMSAFIVWSNDKIDIDPVLKAAIAHLWFITIHPFDDGNGRIARTITDMQLARADSSSQRFYSMSAQICTERKAYYNILEATQKGGLDITNWLVWFIDCLDKAFQATEKTLETVLRKAKFWDKHTVTLFSDRQRMMLNKLFDAFEGKLTTSKWAKITKCSHDSALRDIQDLINKGILIKEVASGRSTGYLLIEPI